MLTAGNALRSSSAICCAVFSALPSFPFSFASVRFPLLTLMKRFLGSRISCSFLLTSSRISSMRTSGFNSSCGARIPRYCSMSVHTVSIGVPFPRLVVSLNPYCIPALVRLLIPVFALISAACFSFTYMLRFFRYFRIPAMS